MKKYNRAIYVAILLVTASAQALEFTPDPLPTTPGEYQDTLNDPSPANDSDGKNPFTAGCYYLYDAMTITIDRESVNDELDYKCKGPARTSYGEYCVHSGAVQEFYTNAPNALQCGFGGAALFQCEDECKKIGHDHGKCVTVKGVCLHGRNSAKCECSDDTETNLTGEPDPVSSSITTIMNNQEQSNKIIQIQD